MISFRKYTPDDKQKCVKLLQKGHDPKFTEERFDWLHHLNPMAPSDIALAVDGDNIAGFYGALKKKAIIDSQEFVLARDIDPVVDPKYRGQGLFTRMLDFALEAFTDIDFFYNFANKASAPGFIKRGWKMIGPLRDYVSLLGYNSLLSSQYALHLASYSRRKKQTTGNVIEVKFDMIENEIDLKPVSPDYKIWVKRDMQFLKWRYKLNPMHNYGFFAHMENNRIKSICIIRQIKEKKHLLILDYIHLRGSDEGLSPFLSFFKSEFENFSVYTWQTSTDSMLKGFITNPTKKNIGQNFLVRQFPGKTIPINIFEIENWYVSRGDSEVF